MFSVKTRWIVAFGVIAILALFGVASLQLRKEVTIKADGEALKVSTYSSTVEEVLKENHIDLEPEDVVEPDLGERLEDEMIIEVHRALPIWVYSDGNSKLVKTQPSTVSEILAKANIVLGELDKVDPALDHYIEAPEKIAVTRVTKVVTEEIRSIPFEMVNRSDNTLAFGEKKVLQQGEEGEEKIITTKILEDGEVVSEDKETVVIKPPKPQVVLKGTIQVASRGADKFEYTKVYNMEATAYSYDAGSLTAMGTKVRVGAVAVDPKVIPLGSRLYIDGYGYAVAEDTGGAIKGMRIDLFMNTREEALRFGRRPVKVYLLK